MAINDKQWVALGPVKGTEWCVLEDAQPDWMAPGGVVLVHEGTLAPHPDAARAALSAWRLLDIWRRQWGVG